MESMEIYQKELALIKKILRENPKGMTVTDISRKIKVNRNSVAKYMDILLISGHAEMITFGPAKVYFPSRRIPISSMLNYTSDYIIVVDKELRIVHVNDSFLNFAKTERHLLRNQRLYDLDMPPINREEVLSNIKRIIEQKDFEEEMIIDVEERDMCFKTKTIPTIFEDGESGVAIIIDDISKQRRFEKALQESEDKIKELFKHIKRSK